MGERMIDTGGVQLCTEAFGDPADAPILLIMGIGASMLGWEDDFCRRVAAGRRLVIRYDHRDTGRSVSYAPGLPGYDGAELVADALGVLDAYGLRAAHIVGVSAGGAFAQRLATDHPDRVRSLVLISSSPATGADQALPAPTEAFTSFVASVAVDWSKAGSVSEYLVGYLRVLSGPVRAFDESSARDLVARELQRARDFRTLQNHGAIAHDDRAHRPLTAIDAPTLVMHGSADPMFPIGHGMALAGEIPGARWLRLDGAGHGVARADWPLIVPAIVAHTEMTP